MPTTYTETPDNFNESASCLLLLIGKTFGLWYISVTSNALRNAQKVRKCL